MSDLFGNHIVGFPTRWLIMITYKTLANPSVFTNDSIFDSTSGFNGGAFSLLTIIGFIYVI